MRGEHEAWIVVDGSDRNEYIDDNTDGELWIVRVRVQTTAADARAAGVRTAEERDAEAFANAIVIEETQPEAAEEDDSQVMDLTLSQPDSAPPPAGGA